MINLFRKDSHIEVMDIVSNCNNCLRFKETRPDNVVDGIISVKLCPKCGKPLIRHTATQSG